jgi:hypothetical protein
MMREPDFKEQYLRARREAASQAIALIQQGMGPAAITMRKLMTDQSVPPAVRFRAAEAIVSLGLRGIEVEDIEARLSQLEAAAEENNKGGKRG